LHAEQPNASGAFRNSCEAAGATATKACTNAVCWRGCCRAGRARPRQRCDRLTPVGIGQQDLEQRMYQADIKARWLEVKVMARMLSVTRTAGAGAISHKIQDVSEGSPRGQRRHGSRRATDQELFLVSLRSLPELCEKSEPRSPHRQCRSSPDHVRCLSNRPVNRLAIRPGFRFQP
jgi:hypothetical protein